MVVLPPILTAALPERSDTNLPLPNQSEDGTSGFYEYAAGISLQKAADGSLLYRIEEPSYTQAGLKDNLPSSTVRLLGTMGKPMVA